MKNTKALKLCLLACALGSSHGALAQQGGGDQIVVTARRQSELLQQTPVAVTALTPDAIKKNSIFNLRDIDKVTPNLRIGTGGGQQGQSFIFIRGVGTFTDSPATDPAVAIYQDDVYVARTQQGVFDLGNIAQIEVLRGPQGTLYGKNAMAGAIKVTSMLPDENPVANFSAAYGNYNEARLSAFYTQPIVEDSLYFGIGAAFRRRDGTMENLGPGGTSINNISTYSGRVMLRYAPTGSPWDLLWSADIYNDASRMANIRLVGLDAPGMAPFDSFVPFLWQPGDDPDVGGGYNVMFDPGIGWQPKQTSGGTSFRASWDGENVTLKSITAYRFLDNIRVLDLDATPESFLNIGDKTNQNQFSQEFQALGSLWGGNLEYIAGLFYFRERIDHQFRVSLPGIFNQDRPNNVGTDSYAAYLNVTWNLSEALSASAGLRYTYEERSLDVLSRDTFTQVVTFQGSQEADFDALSPKFEIDYKWTPEFFTYFSYSEGFKSGGFNDSPASLAEFSQFEPEETRAYEVGVKGDFFDHRAIINIAAFRTIYNDLQESAVFTNPDTGGPLRVVTNAAKARATGVEVEATFRPVEPLTLQGMFGYTDVKYLEFTNSPSGGDATQNRLPLASKINYQVSADYEIPINDVVTVAHVDWAYRSSYFMDVPNTPSLFQPGYGELNARLSAQVTPALELSLYGKNLTDKRAMQTGSSSSGLAWAYFNDPRTYGFEARLQFN